MTVDQLEPRVAPDELRGERAGEAGGAGDEHPRGGVAAQRLGVTHGATLRSRQRRLDRRAALGDLLVGERAVGGAELEPQREALAALADLLAAVEVEDLGRAQQLAAAREHRGAHALGADVLGDDDGDVLVDGRDRRSRPRSARSPCGEAATSGARSSSKRGAASRSQARQTSGWSSPIQPRVGAADEHRAARPGMQERLVAGLDRELGAELARRAPRATPLSAKKSGRPAASARASSRGAQAARPRAQPIRCGSKAGAGWSPANSPAERPAAGSALALGEVGAAGLEQRDALGAVGEVVAGGVEQRAEQRRAQLRVVLRERVGDAIGAARGVAVGEPQPRRHRRGR